MYILTTPDFKKFTAYTSVQNIQLDILDDNMTTDEVQETLGKYIAISIDYNRIDDQLIIADISFAHKREFVWIPLTDLVYVNTTWKLKEI